MIPMTSARIFRKCLVYSLVFFLTAAMFTACGKKDDETEERDTKKTEAPGRNDLRQSKAAYEIGKFDEAAMSFSLAAQPLVKADKTIALPGNVKLELVKVEAGSFEMSAADGENEAVVSRSLKTRPAFAMTVVRVPCVFRTNIIRMVCKITNSFKDCSFKIWTQLPDILAVTARHDIVP